MHIKILQIGSWDKYGSPINWTVWMENPSKDFDAIMTIKDDKVYIDRVEIVEWSILRRMAMVNYQQFVRSGIEALWEVR